MYCKMCGKEISDETVNCPFCGAVQKSDYLPEVTFTQQNNVSTLDTYAIVAIVTSLIGLFTGYISTIVGFIFGILGRKSQKYGGLAKAGIAISVISFILKLIAIVLLSVFSIYIVKNGNDFPITYNFG